MGVVEYFHPADVDVQLDAHGVPRQRDAAQRRPAGRLGRHAHDVEVERQRRRPHGAGRAATARTACGVFMMFKAPPEDTLEWSDDGVEGSSRFLRRLWRMVWEHRGEGAAWPAAPRPELIALSPAQREMRRMAHATLVKVTDDYGRRRVFNTAIAAVMELMNALQKFDDASEQGRAVRHEAIELVVQMLAPIAPHVCHALWRELGHADALIDHPWPQPDPQALVQERVEVVVQVNGKLRAKRGSRCEREQGRDQRGGAGRCHDPEMDRRQAGAQGDRPARGQAGQRGRVSKIQRRSLRRRRRARSAERRRDRAWAGSPTAGRPPRSGADGCTHRRCALSRPAGATRRRSRRTWSQSWSSASIPRCSSNRSRAGRPACTPACHELIARIPTHVTRALLSNSNALHWPRVEDEFGLGALFEHRFVSHLTGRIKPDRDAFEHVISSLGCDAGQRLFPRRQPDERRSSPRSRHAGRRRPRHRRSRTSPAPRRQSFINTLWLLAL